MAITELRPSLYRLTVGFWQLYLWRDADGVTLIDAGAPGCAEAIAADLATLGIGRSDVDRIVLTHFHPDHVGSAADIAEWGSVEILANVADAPIIRGDQPGPAPRMRSEAEQALHARITAAGPPVALPCRVDRELRDGDQLDIAGSATAIAVPGHTEGSIGLYLSGPRVLFTGDTIAEQGGEVMLGPFNLDTDRAIAGFRILAELDADTACFGHGQPVVGNAHAVLAAAAVNPTVL
ncbi:MAG TPA: MBL fold metallo-hydrolase [Pseudonocardiaceae bacterium]|jgi:glyoxylase-like metal-dependent hydrolase (beta-lactamase superfamily II)|nr:MBL fold metallo-hydrolase [Pseudonocardiaceae bacterium]